MFPVRLRIPAGKKPGLGSTFQIPAYGLLDIHCGYRFNIQDQKIQLRFNLLNAMNKTYIATAQNNDTYNGKSLTGFDARSAAVFMGLGRRFSVSIQYQF